MGYDQRPYPETGIMRMRHLFFAALLSVAATAAEARTFEANIPLDHGVLRFSDLSRRLLSHTRASKMRLPSLGHINLNSWRGSLFLHALDKSLGGGCRICVTGDLL